MSCSAMGGSGVVTGAMKLTSLSWISYRIFRPCDGYSPHPYVAQYLITADPISPTAANPTGKQGNQRRLKIRAARARETALSETDVMILRLLLPHNSEFFSSLVFATSLHYSAPSLGRWRQCERGEKCRAHTPRKTQARSQSREAACGHRGER
jgi:hypothetical protein